MTIIVIVAFLVTLFLALTGARAWRVGARIGVVALAVLIPLSYVAVAWIPGITVT